MNDAPTAIVSAQIVSSTAQTPLSAKAIATAFYGESPGYSYFQGWKYQEQLLIRCGFGQPILDSPVE
ncbi:hypothetical protein [Microcoleus sp. OTE_8_concoct_300]|uniref:hypothetical protein n=1 Tax=Microcoleus sp. OTE_8_concoct_300 TaxID=2964710 RepID=UPI00403F62D0